MSIHRDTVTTAALTISCQRERREFHQTGRPASPACLELFRRAFDGDSEAWTSVMEAFKPQLIRWAQSWDKLLVHFDPEDLAQDAILNFYRFAPQRPQLLDTDSLGPVIKYLYLCLKSVALQWERKYKGMTAVVDLDDQHHLTTPVDWMDRVVIDSALRPFIASWTKTEEERTAFSLYFVYSYKPQEIFDADPQLFGAYEEVAKILQRLLRRMRRDAPNVYHALYVSDLPESSSSGSARRKPEQMAFLTVSLSVAGVADRRFDNSAQNAIDTKDINVDTPCPYDDLILLEYLWGRADVAVAAAIEQSPACREAALALHKEVAPLLQSLSYRQCPTPLTLLAYQERLLSGTEQLLLHRHLERCVQCQEELALSKAMDEAARPFEPAMTPLAAVRRVVEAVFQSPLALAQPVRGELGSYRTAQVVIRLTVRPNTGKTRTWSLRGQVRNATGALMMDEVEQVLLERLGEEEQTADQDAAQETSIAPDATSFVYKELAAGDYRLRVLTAQEEIIIRRITVGLDD